MQTLTGYDIPAADLKKFTQEELGAAFERLAPSEDWRTPIDTTVPTASVDLCRAAVAYFTGATLHDVDLGGGLSRVIAEGCLPGIAQ
jgi:hypothetical protein